MDSHLLRVLAIWRDDTSEAKDVNLAIKVPNVLLSLTHGTFLFVVNCAKLMLRSTGQMYSYLSEVSSI